MSRQKVRVFPLEITTAELCVCSLVYEVHAMRRKYKRADSSFSGGKMANNFTQMNLEGHVLNPRFV